MHERSLARFESTQYCRRWKTKKSLIDTPTANTERGSILVKGIVKGCPGSEVLGRERKIQITVISLELWSSLENSTLFSLTILPVSEIKDPDIHLIYLMQLWKKLLAY